MLSGPGDLDPTFVGALTSEAATILDPTQDNALGLVHGAAALLGPRAMTSKKYVDGKGASSTLAYNGFQTDEAALLDLAHAFVQILGDPHASDTLLATRTLLTKYEDPTTRVIAAALDANDRGKMHPEAAIPAARAAGKARIEGKDYIMRDGDVVEFRFST